MGMKAYDSNEVVVIYGGTIIDSGRADGEFVRIEYAEDAYSGHVGADGEVTRSKSNNEMARITITVMHTSTANTALDALHSADKLAPSGSGVLPLMVKDNNGLSLHVAEHAWIVKRPVAAYAKEATTREWVLDCDNMTGIIGGSSDV